MTAPAINRQAPEPTPAELEARRALCGERVTLDGQPAVICGAALRFATARDARTGLGAQWSWATVARVVASGGHFQS